MSARWRARTAIAIAVWSYCAGALGLVLAHRITVLTGDGGPEALRGFLDTLMFDLAWVGFPGVGALLAVRRPGNPVGWMLLLVGASMYAFEPAGGWAELLLASGGEVTGALLWVVAVASATMVVLTILAFTLLLLQFPNGEVTAVSRVLTRFALVVGALLVVARLLRPGELDGLALPNPFGVSALPGGEEVVGPLTAALFGITVMAFGRLVVRYRGAGTIERKQFQWVLASVATFPFVWSLGNVVEGMNYWVGQFIAIGAFQVAFLGFVAALYRAVTRHDLYGIDRLVSRTLTYAVVTAVLVSAYLGLVVGLGAATRELTGESGDLVVALSTLAVATLFRPLRRRVHGAVDRRFNRAAYDAARTIDAFGRGLRDEVSLDAIVEDLRGVATATFHPIGVGVVLTGAESAP